MASKCHHAPEDSCVIDQERSSPNGLGEKYHPNLGQTAWSDDFVNWILNSLLSMDEAYPFNWITFHYTCKTLGPVLFSVFNFFPKHPYNYEN